ncbi:MAG: alpha/beta hydrolase [Acidobacteria bacterium]|nr:alpha/beta hydrolase [Acidobacteriota bacterium]
MKNILIVCAFLLTGNVSKSPESEQCLPLKVRNPEGNYIIPGALGDIVYRRIDGQHLSLDAYVQKGAGRRPAVIIIHGGGWDTGSRVAFTGQFLEMMTSAGFNWFSIDYRKNGLHRYENGVDDLLAAIDFIKCHAAEFRIDTRRIALIGEDSGVHLAAMAAIKRPGVLNGLVLAGGFYDLTQSPQLKARLDGLKETEAMSFLHRASPAGADLRAFPATLIVHGAADSESPLSAAAKFCDNLKKASRSCRLLEVEKAIHRPENWWPSQWGYKEQLIAWMKQRLDGEKLKHLQISANLKKNIVFDAKNNLKMDAFKPAGRGPFPAAILVHGGGWEAGDKVTYITPLFEPLAKAGIAWFSIDYRLTPAVRHPQQLDDLRTAVRFVAANAKRFNIDPHRIAIIGESASGQMVARVASERLPEVAAAVSFYGVYDFLPMAGQITPRSIPARLFGITELDSAAGETLRRYSPLYQAKAGQIPLLLICGNKDGLYAQHTAFVEKLKAIGARFNELTVEGAPHGVENWEGHPGRLDYKNRLVEWLKTNMPAGR